MSGFKCGSQERHQRGQREIGDHSHHAAHAERGPEAQGRLHYNFVASLRHRFYPAIFSGTAALLLF